MTLPISLAALAVYRIGACSAFVMVVTVAAVGMLLSVLLLLLWLRPLLLH